MTSDKKYTRSKHRKYWPSEVHLSRKVWLLPVPVLDAVVAEIRKLDCFSPHKGNTLKDSHGYIEVAGHNICWRLEHLDRNYECLSPNPHNNKITARVLSVTLAEEVTALVPRPQPPTKPQQ